MGVIRPVVARWSLVLALMSVAAGHAIAQPRGSAAGATVDLGVPGTPSPNLNPAPPEAAFGGLGIYLDQDWLLDVYGIAGNEDRNYSMGLAIGSSGTWIHTAFLDGLLRLADCPWIGRIHDAHLSSEVRGAERHTFTIGNTAFTPDRLNTPDVEEEDRPYASLLYFTAGRVTTNEEQDFALTSEFTLGFLGLGIAEPVQKAIHKKLREMNDSETPYEPLGWSHQISDGGEATLGYRVAVAHLVSDSTCNELGHDISVQGEASAGYYTNAAAGATLRIGRIRTPFWAFNGNPLNNANEAAKPCRRGSRNWEAFAWITGRERFVVYNALLEGQFRQSDHRIAAGDVARGVGEFDAGLSIGVLRGHLAIAYAGRSTEFHSDLSRSHTWGGFYLSYAQER